jgi:CBS domain-containing protein
MKAMDVMVRDVVTVRPDDDVAEAIKLLMVNDISALPVVDVSGTVVGVLSEADLMHRPEIGTEKHLPRWLEAIMPASGLAHDFAKAHGRKVAEVMSDTVISAAEETPLGEVATLLEKHRIKRLPVLRDGKLVGIVSRADLVRALLVAHRGRRRRRVGPNHSPGAARAAGGSDVDGFRFAQRHRPQRRRASVGAHQLRRRAQGAAGAGRGDSRRQASDGRDHSRLLM